MSLLFLTAAVALSVRGTSGRGQAPRTDSSGTRRRGRHSRRMTLVFLTALLGSLVSPAAAVPPPPDGPLITDPVLDVQVEVVTPQPVLAGNTITWRILFTCASPNLAGCENAQITVPIPPGVSPEGVVISMNNREGYSAAGIPGVVSAFNDGSVATFDFVDPLPSGTSGEIFASWKSETDITPDGTVFTATASFTASNATDKSASASAVVAASSDIAIDKYRGADPLVPPPEPPLDSDVTYTIAVADRNRLGVGHQSVQNAVVRDVLPTSDGLAPRNEAQVLALGDNRPAFVSASDGGTYDYATNTVTFPPISQAELFRNIPVYRFVTVSYPAANGFQDS